MQNSAAGGTEETLTRAFALILVSFSYSGGKNTSHFHHSSILCTQTYIRLSSILLKYLYKIHCSPFIFSICRVIFLLIIRVRTVNLWQSNGFIHVCVCQGGSRWDIAMLKHCYCINGSTIGAAVTVTGVCLPTQLMLLGTFEWTWRKIRSPREKAWGKKKNSVMTLRRVSTCQNQTLTRGQRSKQCCSLDF